MTQDEIIKFEKIATSLSLKLSRDLMALGDMQTKTTRIEFKGGAWPNNEVAMGGMNEDALARFFKEILNKYLPNKFASILANKKQHTPSQNIDESTEFEKEYQYGIACKYPLYKNDDGNYVVDEVQDAWLIWQARAQLDKSQTTLSQCEPVARFIEDKSTCGIIKLENIENGALLYTKPQTTSEYLLESETLTYLDKVLNAMKESK